jgi:hypothetical protein
MIHLMLKIFPILLIIIGLYLLNSISTLDSQNYGCDNDGFGNYECYLGDQDVMDIDLEIPSSDYKVAIDQLPWGGELTYDRKG